MGDHVSMGDRNTLPAFTAREHGPCTQAIRQLLGAGKYSWNPLFVRRRPIYGHSEHVQKSSWSLDVWPWRYVTWQTDRQTDRHAHRNTSHPYRGEALKW